MLIYYRRNLQNRPPLDSQLYLPESLMITIEWKKQALVLPIEQGSLTDLLL